MHYRSLIAAAIAASAFISVASPLFAQAPITPGTPAAQAGGHGHGKLMKELDLTPAEKAKIKPIILAQRSQMEAIRSNSALSEKQKRQQMKELHESTMSQIRADLTPAQQKELDEFIAQQKAARLSKKGTVPAP